MEAFTQQQNGIGSHHSTVDTSNILEALQLIHNPAVKNDVRRQASDYLEQLKSSEDAPQYGFMLSTDTSQSHLVQHYGLSLLGHVIRHEGHHLTDEQNVRLRGCVLDLARSVNTSQPAFIRNKIAELWIELAKRSWVLEWFDMDEQLVQLWSQDLVHKDLVLTILENLSEDVFIREDTTAILRGKDLNSALVEIFTSTSNYAGGIKIGETTHHMRFGEVGWLQTINHFVAGAVSQGSLGGQSKEIVIKALATLRSAFLWAMIPAIVSSNTLPTVCSTLTQEDPDMIIASCDVLISVYSRVRLEELEVQALVHPLLHPDSVALLRRLYDWAVVTIDDIDNPKYTISKKLSELLSLLSDHICQYPPPNTATLDLTSFLQLLTAVARHESLVVSIPVVHSWVKMLEIKSWRSALASQRHAHAFLEVASGRLIQYDQLPGDPPHPVVAFVNDEIELHPERQGFYLNFRRLCAAVVEWVALASPDEAVPWVIGRVGELLDSIMARQGQFDPSKIERVSEDMLQSDAAFSLFDAACKGFGRLQQTPDEYRELKDELKSWFIGKLRGNSFNDPQIRERQIKTAVEAAHRLFQEDTEFAFIVLEHILSSFLTRQENQNVYNEAVEELNGYAVLELRRLSLQHADYFVTYYDQLQSKFAELIGQIGGNERLQIDLKSILFLIVQRATTVDPGQRLLRLQEFMRPIATAWADPKVQSALASIESFTRSQAFDQVGPYLVSLRAGNIEEWSQVSYDARGVQIQDAMADGFAALPIRDTRILLSVSTDGLDEDSDTLKVVSELWSPMVPSILECVLRTTSYNHALHDPSSWPNVPAEAQGVIQRVLRDRYWQSGISAGSMGEFHTKVKSTKSTLEGFASSVRGRIRNNLEQCYSILHTLGRLGSVFYSFQHLPELFAQIAIDTTTPLNPHHFSIMLQMLPKLINECPPENRQDFLTPILGSLLVQMDTKLSHEWEKMSQRKQIKHDDEDLSDEMRDESVLRQTTYKAVNIVAMWLNPKREQRLSTKKSIVNGNHLKDKTQPTMRTFVVSNTQILEKLLVFITHAIAFKDQKSSHTVLMAVQRLIPDFASEEYLKGQDALAAREFISKNMLETAITCLHDGYFADHQHYYAQLIATIWISYGLPKQIPNSEGHYGHVVPALTDTPRKVLLSLPGMTESKVANAAAYLLKDSNESSKSLRRQRAVILSFLEGVRGVRISEIGKIDTKQQQNRILEKYKQRELLGMQSVDDGAQQGDGAAGEIDLGGVAAMFAT